MKSWAYVQVDLAVSQVGAVKDLVGQVRRGPRMPDEAPAKIPWNSQQKMYRKCRFLGVNSSKDHIL